MERRRSDDPVRRANLDDVHQELRGRYLNHPKQLGAFVVRRVREVQVAAGKELRADGDQVRAKIELIEIACTCRVSDQRFVACANHDFECLAERSLFGRGPLAAWRLFSVRSPHQCAS